MDEKAMYNRYWAEGVAGWNVHADLSDHMKQFLVDLVSGRDVLDYGGGDGERYGALLRTHSSSCTVVDVSTAVLERRRLSGDSVVHTDDLPAVQERFDIVIALEVLEHLLDPEAAVRAMAAMLRVGGRAVVSVPNAFSALNRARMVFGRLPASGVGGEGVRGRTYLAPHVRFFDLASLVHLMMAGGMKVTDGYTDGLDLWRFGRRVPARMRRLDLRKASVLLPQTLLLVASK